MKPIQTIIKLLKEKNNEIETWFTKEWQNLTPLPYFSCDIRHASYKLGIVDTNVFPGGFNNLCNSYSDKTAQALKKYFSQNYPSTKNIALLAESHTRNKFYLFNILKIKALLEMAGLNCRVTMPLDHFREDPLVINLSETDVLKIFKPTISPSRPDAPSKSRQSVLHLGSDFTADLILTNNDFSSGIPKQFAGLEDQIIPHPSLGWHNRYKSEHFKILTDIICRFAKEFSLDPWLLSPMTETVEGVNMDNFANLAAIVDQLIADIQVKYDKYDIPETPYVFVKNDAGTYGLGLISVTSGDDVRSLNRKKTQQTLLHQRRGQK